MLKSSVSPVATALCLLATACGPQDAGNDAAADATPTMDTSAPPADGTVDARPPSDAAPDAAMDARADAAVDARPDTPRDAPPPDAATDAPHDAGVGVPLAYDAALVATCCADDAGVAREPDYLAMSPNGKYAIAIAGTDANGYGDLYAGRLTGPTAGALPPVSHDQYANAAAAVGGSNGFDPAAGFFSAREPELFWFASDVMAPSGLPTESNGTFLRYGAANFVAGAASEIEYMDFTGFDPVLLQRDPSTGYDLFQFVGVGLEDPFRWAVNCSSIATRYRGCAGLLQTVAVIAYDYGSNDPDAVQLIGGYPPQVLSTRAGSDVGWGDDGLHLWWLENANWSDPILPGGALYLTAIDVTNNNPTAGPAVLLSPTGQRARFLAGSAHGAFTAYASKNAAATRAQLFIHDNTATTASSDRVFEFPSPPANELAFFSPDESALVVLTETATQVMLHYVSTSAPSGTALRAVAPPQALPPVGADGNRPYYPLGYADAGDHTLFFSVTPDGVDATLSAIDLSTGATQTVSADVDPAFWSVGPDREHVVFVDFTAPGAPRHGVADARPPYAGVLFDDASYDPTGTYFSAFWVGPDHVAYGAPVGDRYGLVVHGVDGSGGYVSADVGYVAVEQGWPDATRYLPDPQRPGLLYYARSPTPGVYQLLF